MSSTTRWLATGKIDGAASIAGAWCACCARRAIASVALTLAASPGFGVYVTYYLLTSRNPLILQRILDGWLATVSHESARSAKMALILAGVWLLVDYPSGLLAFVAIAALGRNHRGPQVQGRNAKISNWDRVHYGYLKTPNYRMCCPPVTDIDPSVLYMVSTVNTGDLGGPSYEKVLTWKCGACGDACRTCSNGSGHAAPAASSASGVL